MSDIFALFERLKLQKTPAPSGPVEWVVACLGNPGRRYENTRHNAGFIAADYIADARGFRIDRLRFASLTGECAVAGRRTLFLKPTTFMNNSGQAVRDALTFYKLSTDRLIVIFDDISLAPGRLRIRTKVSDGGHNGIKRIIYHTASDPFLRIKIGVGDRPHPDYDLADWVLSVPDAETKTHIEAAIRDADKALDLLVTGDAAAAMNRYNGT
jgi:PTH1 family peptidyl-tRNA hydrolase